MTLMLMINQKLYELKFTKLKISQVTPQKKNLLLILFSIFYIYFKKEKCKRSQLWSMDWCEDKPFGHQTSHQSPHMKEPHTYYDVATISN